MQWSNWFRGTLYHYCGNRAGINWIRSGFSGHYTDRIWHISCKTVTNRNFNHCYWTGYQNSYDQPLFAQCGADYIMAGIYGVYCNSYHDRKFQLYCCRAPYKYTRHCYLSGYVNGWRGGMSYHAGAGSRVFTGAYSYHDNNQKWVYFLQHSVHILTRVISQFIEYYYYLYLGIVSGGIITVIIDVKIKRKWTKLLLE